tara:strand:+ start:732 stop:1124 length:393 start_codon:yes stop_codon:yes gene_type:complete
MASILRVNTLTDASSNNSIATSFVAGGSAKAYGYAQQRTSTVELKDSFNISSWNDDGTGRSTWNINSDMANATYTTVVSSSYDSTSNSGVVGSDEVWVTGAGVFKQDTFFGNGSFYDNDYVYAVAHGDLA